MMVKSLVTALIALGPLTVLAQVAATADASPEPDAPYRQRPFPGRYGQVAPTERELEDAGTFMREHAPNRWQAVQSLPDDGVVRRGVMGFIVARYRALQDVKKDDPKLYDVKLRQLAVEDELYGMVASETTPEEREKHRDALRIATRKLLELNLAERELRIDRLRQSLSTEEQRLATDRAQLDTHVNGRLEAFINEGTAALRKDMFPVRRPPRSEAKPTTQPAAK